MEALRKRLNSSAMKCLAFAFTMFLLTPGIASSAAWQWIEPGRVYEMMKEGSGMWLIDLRNSAANENLHIEGSVNIPALELRYKKFPATKTLILVDDSLGQRNAMETAEMLSKKGLERVFVLAGGIVSWELDGFPVARGKHAVKTVTREELKWALTGEVPLKVFDMRDVSDIQTGKIEGSLPVEGRDMPERLSNLRELLKKEEGKDLAGNLKKRGTVVLIFSEADDAEGLIERVIPGIKTDVRYLYGGYKAFATEKFKGLDGTGNCPACEVKRNE